MNKENYMEIKFLSYLENENFARLAVASFCSIKIKDIELISDIKTAVSEAITNAIVHGYENEIGLILIKCEFKENLLKISISDSGVGIENIEKARMPFFTSKPETERSGMGFTVMEGFMDKIEINSKNGQGTEVILFKNLEN